MQALLLGMCVITGVVLWFCLHKKVTMVTYLRRTLTKAKQSLTQQLNPLTVLFLYC